jgi:hypothetical protein
MVHVEAYLALELACRASVPSMFRRAQYTICDRGAAVLQVNSHKAPSSW